jgi:hypothetical protein
MALWRDCCIAALSALATLLMMTAAGIPYYEQEKSNSGWVGRTIPGTDSPSPTAGSEPPKVIDRGEDLAQGAFVGIPRPRDNVYIDANPPYPDDAVWRSRLTNASASRAQCQVYGWSSATKQNKVYYGVQLNFELHLLRILLYEVYPYVDVIVLVENVRHHAFQLNPYTMKETRKPSPDLQIRFDI